MIWLCCQSAVLFSGETSPVKIEIGLSSVKYCFKNRACWFTNGFVGERNKIFWWFFLSSFAIRRRAMMVFPIPVGSTTKVLA